MTRSRRKMPIRGIAGCKSEKQDKRVANRKLRRKTNEALKKGDDILPKLREVSDVWAFGMVELKMSFITIATSMTSPSIMPAG